LLPTRCVGKWRCDRGGWRGRGRGVSNPSAQRGGKRGKGGKYPIFNYSSLRGKIMVSPQESKLGERPLPPEIGGEKGEGNESNGLKKRCARRRRTWTKGGGAQRGQRVCVEEGKKGRENLFLFERYSGGL